MMRVAGNTIPPATRSGTPLFLRARARCVLRSSWGAPVQSASAAPCCGEGARQRRARAALRLLLA